MSLKVVRFFFAFIISLALAWPVFPALALDTSEANAAYRWIKVTSPNGGEVMTVGDVYRITWQASSNIDKVSIGYKSCYSCLTWIVTNIPNTGYYDWTCNVGNTHPKTQFTIQITGYQSGVGSDKDYSDSVIYGACPSPLPPAHLPKPPQPPRLGHLPKPALRHARLPAQKRRLQQRHQPLP